MSYPVIGFNSDTLQANYRRPKLVNGTLNNAFTDQKMKLLAMTTNIRLNLRYVQERTFLFLPSTEEPVECLMKMNL
jgi:hypothetical protein